LLAVAGCACVGAAVAVGACIVVPPPDMQQPPPHRPTILHGSVQPPTDLLRVWPAELLVPVELDDPNQPFVWDVFIDYVEDPKSPQGPQHSGQGGPGQSAPDGGVIVVSVPLDKVDPNGRPYALDCHQVEVLVAHDFGRLPNGTPAWHTFDTVNGDSVKWTYPGPGGLDGCLSLDAGDGMFRDAGSDGGLPSVPPDSGGDF
jgi:hypothetical protein